MDAQELEKELRRLLWQGNPSEAEKLWKREHASLEAERVKLADKERILELLRPSGDTVPRPAAPTRRKRRVQVPTRGSSSIDKGKRAADIIKIANELAQSGITGDVETAAVLGEAKKRSLDLGVAENREKTVVSNILMRSGGYEKVMEGVYRAPQNGEGSADGSPSEPSNATASANGANHGEG